MCWISDKNPVKKIASENITCYKVFYNNDVIWNQHPIKFLGIIVWNKYIIKEFFSLHRNYIYVPYENSPEVNVLIAKNKYSYRWYIDKGYHLYRTLDKAKEKKI